MKNSMLTIGLAALLCAACSNEITDDSNATANTDGERYMAISLVAGNGSATRADYENGDEVEVDDSNIYFFFFDNAGAAVSVTDSGENFVKGSEAGTWTTNSDGANVTKILCKIAVLRTQSGKMPSQVVAVLNATFTPATSSLANLRAQVVASGKGYQDKGSGSYVKRYFMMSNSVYNNGTDNLYATPLTTSNFGITSSSAQANPVSIYVERVVAKATMTKPTDNKKVIKDTNANDKYLKTVLYARLDGWMLFNTAKTTTLLKNIEGVDKSWSDASSYRSYWANTTGVDLDNVQLTWNNIVAEHATEEVSYPFENTLAAEEGKDNHTSVAIATTLVNESGEAQEIALWLSQYYFSKDLKQAVADFLGNDLYSYDATAGTWTSISDLNKNNTDDNVKYIQYDNVAGSNYEVQPTAVGTTWYKKGSTTAYTTDELTTILGRVPKARLWKDGKCYYFAEITHTDGSPAIVRNHVYQLSINSLTGLGTPVVNPDTDVDPERPSDTQTWYLDAQVNVLAWKVVANALDFVTSNPSTTTK